METVEFIKANGLKALTEQLAIKVVHHPSLPLLVLNYNQIDSPKTNKIVKQCRGLVLEMNTWKPILRGFDRFFNWNEVCEEMPLFNWSDCSAVAKEDGTFTNLGLYNGQWIMSTRGSFAEGQVGSIGLMTWEQLFCTAMGWNDLQDCHLPKREDACWNFELCSLQNKIIRMYTHPCAILTGMRYGENLEYQVTNKELDILANEYSLQRPETFYLHSIQEVEAFLREKELTDQTFEGIVICDNEFHRWKCKSSTWLALNHMKGESGFTAKNVIPMILSGDTSELIAYFPEVEEICNEMRTKIDEAYAELRDLFYATREIESQKDFALEIRHSPFSALLFTLRKEMGNEAGQTDLRVAWRHSAELIVKKLFK